MKERIKKVKMLFFLVYCRYFFKYQPIQIFNKCNPIVMGVDVEKGILRIGTPLVVYDKEVNIKIKKKNVRLGLVSSIEANHKPL